MKQNKKRGFTLIELLAVIVILAIIALIAVPVIMNIINKANKSAFKDTAYGVISAGELYFAEQLLEPNGMQEDVTFNLPDERLQVKGDVPTGTMTVTKDGKISIKVQNGRYCITKGLEDKDVTISENLDDCSMSASYNIGDVIYYNPETNEMCTDYVETNSDYDVSEGCLKWIVYNVNGSSTKLMLDHNIRLEYNSFTIYEEYLQENNSIEDFVLVTENLFYDRLENWEPIISVISADDILTLLPFYNALEDKTDWYNKYDQELNNIFSNFNPEDYSTQEELGLAIYEQAKKDGLILTDFLGFGILEDYAKLFYSLSNEEIYMVINDGTLLKDDGHWFSQLHNEYTCPSITLINGQIKIQSEERPMIQELYAPESMKIYSGNIYEILEEKGMIVKPANADKSKIKINMIDENDDSMDELGNISIDQCDSTERYFTIKTTDGSNITKTSSFSGGGCPA